MRIFYSPVSADLSRPGDRRRFCGYAARRGYSFATTGPANESDVVVLSLAADLSQWARPRQNGPKVVLDFVDSYLAEDPRSMRSRLRGVAKFVFGRNRRLHLSYRRLLIDACRCADAVVCSTEEQKAAIAPYCPNVHVILDFQEADVRCVKTEYARKGCFNLVWEGVAENLVTFRDLVPILRDLRSREKIALHLITDLRYPLGLGSLFPRETKGLAERVFGKLDGIYLYEWNSTMLGPVVTACDLAVIPIPLEIGLLAGKPANKLHLLWRMGLPVLTSATPAFRRAMDGVGLDMACANPEDWRKKLRNYLASEEARREGGQRGRRYADTRYGDEAMARLWDRVFMSIGALAGQTKAG